ncbi:dermonecrotic toxin SPH-like isoform X2 [Haemaphysalis longicornis]
MQMRCCSKKILRFAFKTVAAEQRPFFVIGHMANSVDEVDSFVEKGSNAVETDVRFTANGTVTRVHHGFPCDCLRNCSRETEFTEYLEHLRSVTSTDEAKFKGKLSFLFLDLKTSDIDEAYKYQAGVDLSTKLTEHLWRNVTPTEALNVLLYVGSVEKRDIFAGALDTIAALPEAESWMERVGFEFGDFKSPSENEEAFAELGIDGHRWQGDGVTNCLVDFLGDFKLPEIIACRDGQSTDCDYVDKAYAWTVDTPHTIETMIKLGLDGMITNKPENVLKVMKQDDVAPLVRPAGPQDSPWTRVVTGS